MDMPLYDILNTFQKGHSHIAVVYKDVTSKKELAQESKEGENLELRARFKKKNKKPEASSIKGEDVPSFWKFRHANVSVPFSGAQP